MKNQKKSPVEVVIVAVPETAGSALYGMLDVLLAAGNIWQTIVGAGEPQTLFSVRIISTDGQPFLCGNNIPVNPDLSVEDKASPRIVILPELWLGPDEHLKGRYPELMKWIRRQSDNGASVYSACSGAIMLAESGLLNDNRATSHWGYQDLFRRHYPKVKFNPNPNLVFADDEGRVVTAGGITSWHDLAIHIISRYGSPGEALRIAKVYLLKWHGEGDLPYETLVRSNPHSDSVVRECEEYLKEHFRDDDALKATVKLATIPERTLKRRFKKATGLTLINYLQNLRVEEAKNQLETTETAVDDICFDIGYEDPSFFRRLFKRRTGMTPSQYRRMFKPVIEGAMGGL